MATQAAPQRAGRSGGDEGGPGTASATGAARRASYVLPVVHVHLPERAVEAGFWGTLVGVAAFGVVDPPLAALIGGAVLVVRHSARSRG